MSVRVFLLALLQGVTPAAGSIEGGVMNAAGVVQQPLGDARVELSGPRLIATRTDARGRFVFPNLPAGRYRLSVTRDGFIRETAPPIVLGPGQRVNDVILNLQRAPTLFGTVLDTFGQPKPNVLVEALRMGYGARGGRVLTSLASALTDDYGRYRLYWLDPGEYKVVAQDVPPTYYPGVVDPAEAQIVRLRSGREVDLGELRMNQSLPPLKVTGDVISQITGTSLPVPSNVTLTLQGVVDSKFQFKGVTVYNPNTGLYEGFTVSGALNGLYAGVAQASTGERGFVEIDARRELYVSPVCGRCLQNVRIIVGPPLKVDGAVLSDSGEPFDLTTGQVTLTAVEPALPSPPAVLLNQDGTFTVAGVHAGAYLLAVSGLPGDAYVKAARAGKTDVLEQSVEVRYGSSEPLQILVNPNGGRLSGFIADRGGQPFGGADVVLAPDPARRHRVDQYRIESSDKSGAFVIHGIPPGDYKLFAWEKVEPNAYLNADFMKEYEQFGIPVRVAPGPNAPVRAQVIPLEP